MRQWLQQEDNRADVNRDEDEEQETNQHSRRGELRSPQGDEKGDGRIEKRHQKEDGPKLGKDSQEDRFTFHHGRPGVPGALQVPSTSARALRRFERPIGSPEHLQDNPGSSTTP